MNIKTTTKAYSERKDPNFIIKDSGEKTQSASEMQKFGQDNVGDVLNRIADPQWVDPNKKIRAVGDKNLDKDAFMKLMLAQMKHQDPTNPMQAHEMAAQLASFSSVEQLQNLNTTMEGLKKDQAPMQQFEALNLIGKSVSGDSAQLARSKGDSIHNFQYKLLKDAEEVSLKIRNANGEDVRTVDLRGLKAGSNSFDWNGQDERGVDQPPGDYSLVIEAKDGAGQKVGVESQFDGVISGVKYTGAGPLLLIGNRTIKFSDVRKIVDPRLKNDDQKNEKNVSQDLKIPSNQKETIKSNLDQLAMSRGMLNKVEKETGKELAP